MSVTLQYSPEDKILYATIIDRMSSSEFTNALNSITGSDNYPPDVRIMWDASSINTSIGNFQCEMNIIEIQKRFPEDGKAKIAIITSSDYTFGMRRMHEMISDSWPQNIMIFSNFSEAEEWLAGEGK